MVSVQLLSHVQLFATPWTAARQDSLSITTSWRLLKLMSIKSVMPSNHLIFCCPLLLPPLIFPRVRVISNESVFHIRWSKYWSFSFSISPSSEYSGLISFRIDWFDLLALQGTLKSLLQQHSSKASILQCSAFFMVQFSHPYMTTRKPLELISKFSKVTGYRIHTLKSVAFLHTNNEKSKREIKQTMSDFIFWGSKITADGDCSHEIKRRLLLGRKVMTNLDSILKIRDITLPTKVRLVKAMVLPVSHVDVTVGL